MPAWSARVRLSRQDGEAGVDDGVGVGAEPLAVGCPQRRRRAQVAATAGVARPGHDLEGARPGPGRRRLESSTTINPALPGHEPGQERSPPFTRSRGIDLVGAVDGEIDLPGTSPSSNRSERRAPPAVRPTWPPPRCRSSPAAMPRRRAHGPNRGRAGPEAEHHARLDPLGRPGGSFTLRRYRSRGVAWRGTRMRALAELSGQVGRRLELGMIRCASTLPTPRPTGRSC